MSTLNFHFNSAQGVIIPKLVFRPRSGYNRVIRYISGKPHRRYSTEGMRRPGVVAVLGRSVQGWVWGCGGSEMVGLIWDGCRRGIPIHPTLPPSYPTLTGVQPPTMLHQHTPTRPPAPQKLQLYASDNRFWVNPFIGRKIIDSV